MSLNPMVSVIIPAYNRSHLVTRAIQSVLNQTYKDFEVIVVDDGSTDDTKEAIANFHNEKIRYLRHEKNKGGSAARNTGIKAARGEYIAFLDSDDEWVPEKLEKQIQKIKQSPKKVGVIYCGHILVSDKSKRVLRRVKPTLRGNVHAVSFQQGLLGGGSKPLIRKECFQKSGLYDETLPALQDADMYVRLSEYYEFDFVPECLAIHHVHEGKLSTHLEVRINAREKFCLKYQNEFLKYPEAYSDNLNRLGILYTLSGDFNKARARLWESVRVNPLQVFAYIRLFPLLFFPALFRKNMQRNLAKNTIDGIKLYW